MKTHSTKNVNVLESSLELQMNKPASSPPQASQVQPLSWSPEFIGRSSFSKMRFKGKG